MTQAASIPAPIHEGTTTRDLDQTQMGRQRPLAAHRFAIEVDLVTAADLDEQTLVRVLTQLATAGLHRMLRNVCHVALDGTEHPAGTEDEGLAEADVVRRLLPPADERIGGAVGDLDRAIGVLRQVLGRHLPDARDTDEERGRGPLVRPELVPRIEEPEVATGRAVCWRCLKGQHDLCGGKMRSERGGPYLRCECPSSPTGQHPSRGGTHP